MRLLEILVMRRQWRAQVAQVQRMHGWVRAVEHILSGQWVGSEISVTNAQVAERFDRWRKEVTQQQEGSELTEEQQRALAHFLKVTMHLRPWLVQCYDVPGLPRTDNALEDTIRAIKHRYRRISGRKNWNCYLLRYGRYVSYFEWLGKTPTDACKLECLLRAVGRDQWRAGSAILHERRSEQEKKYRFRRNGARYLCSLEVQWEQTTGQGVTNHEEAAEQGTIISTHPAGNTIKAAFDPHLGHRDLLTSGGSLFGTGEV